MENKKDRLHESIFSFNLSLGLKFIGIAFIALIFLIFPIFFDSYTLGKLGSIGDFFGGIMNPIVAIAAAFLTFLAFYIQYQANEDVRKQFKIQQFENQFFEMLRLHKENINEMKISGYDISTSTSYDSQGGITNTTITKIEKITEGRKVFVTMCKELIACYELCELYNIEHNYNKQYLLELAYNIFFFGSASKISGHEKINPNFIKTIKDQLKIIRDKHKETLGEANELNGLNNEIIRLHFKYAPFTGHETRLGHYYRHLYSTVKYVVQNEKDKIINYKQARSYLKILRSQMSNHEQLLLYYNIVIGYGIDWVNNGYVTKYRMLHNLPVDKVKYVINPREYFKEFINEIKETQDPLFEWRDN